MITSGKGRYKVFLEKKELDDDLVYILGGGEKSHIGGAVICEPDQKPQVLSIGTHHDCIVLMPIAERACKKYNKTVVAVGGIHVDNATKEEIDILVKNCKELEKCI
jgi:metal-dependent hydrolase (beta-lactamase superfamily II)